MNGPLKKMEGSSFKGLQRKSDCSFRMCPNSVCQRALPSTPFLSICDSLLNTEGTDMEGNTLSEYGTFQK